MLRAIELGYVQSEIQDAAYDYQRSVESGDAVVVGVNRFQTDEEAPIPILKVDEQIGRDQAERLRAVRESRDAAKAAACLDKIADAAAGDANLLPHILEAVEARVTVGEISGRLRGIWGEYHENVTV